MEPLMMENSREMKKQKTAEAKETPWSRLKMDKVAEEKRALVGKSMAPL